MTDLAKSGIVRLKTDFGVTLDSIDDIDVVDTILRLANKTIDAGMAWQSRAILRPCIRIGNLELRRIAIGAQEFLEQVAEWYPQDERLQNLSLVFCMANRDNPELIWGFDNPRKWRKMIRQWNRKINVDYYELLEALIDFQEKDDRGLEVIGQKQKPASADLAVPDDRTGAYGPVIEILCHEYGEDPETWIWRKPIEEVELLLDAYAERQEAGRRRGRKPDGSPRAVAPDPNRPHVQWMRRFQMYIDQVGRERQEAA